MMSKLSVPAFFLACTSMGIAIYTLTKEAKIGFVNSQELVYEYHGTKEVQEKFEMQKTLWQANLDSLKSDYESELNLVRQTEEVRPNPEQMDLARPKLIELRENVLKYERFVQESTQLSEQEMMGGVLNQINSFVEKYGKENGYDYILGTTLSGSILYGAPSKDITDDVLEGLNHEYFEGE